jgi:thymidylate synthase
MSSSNEEILYNDVMLPLRKKLDNSDFTGNTVELIDFHGKFNPKQPFLKFGEYRQTNREYVEKELAWYQSMDRCITGHVDDVKIWNQVCSKDKKVQSNYGWCIWSKENYLQYEHALNNLANNPNGRQACMIYTRPSIQDEWNENGMHDFICTFTTSQFIRKNKLEYVVYQRSCDCFYGFTNDLAFHCFVYHGLIDDLKALGKNVDYGEIHYNCASIHVYDRHYDVLKKITDDQIIRQNLLRN